MASFDYDAPAEVYMTNSWSTKNKPVTYRRFAGSAEYVGEIVPQEPDSAALKRLRDLNRAVEKERYGDDEPELPVEEFAGVVHSFDPEKGYGFIKCEEAGLVLLHITCLRASGYKSAAPGSAVHFEAIERSKGWMAFRILSLDQPRAQSH